MKKIKEKVIAIIITLTIATLFSCSGNEAKKGGNTEPKSFSEAENVKAENYADRTIMYYMLGSDLEENSLAGTEIIADICKVNYPSNMNFIIMTGGSDNSEVEKTRKDPDLTEMYSKFYDINWDVNQIWKVENNALKVVEKDFGKEDMTEERTLEKFVSYVKKNFPAKKYDIIFSDHGGAALYSFGKDTRFDGTDSSCLSIKEITDAFKNANIKFNTVGFDACLMASFEFMYVLEPYADYLIAAEETSFGGWNYSFLNYVAEDVNIDPVTYGTHVVDAFIEKGTANANSLGLYSLNGFREAVDESLTKFSKNMNAYLSEDVYMQSLYAVLKYTIGLGYISISDIRDLRDFLDWVTYVENYEFPKDLRDSAKELWDKVEPFVLYYRTLKQKNEAGGETTGGLNFVFPIEDVEYYEDDVDSALLTMKYYPDSLNKEFRLMYRLAFLRKALVSTVKNNAYEADDNVVAAELDQLCDRAVKKYQIPESYVNKIRETIVPNLVLYRVKACEGGNIDFVKKVNNNVVTFDYIFDSDIEWMLYEPVATARTYSINGAELKLGEARIPRRETRNGNKVTWSILPEEDRWFFATYGDYERLVEFIVEEDEKEVTDTANLNYLFDKSISGFIPAVLKRYEDDKDDENIIQIHVDFTGSNKEGKIVGFTRYDQNANMPAKDLESFKKGDKVWFIANFEDFKTTKNISYIYEDEFPATEFKAIRGNTNTQSVYFKYSVEDIYFETYDFEVKNMFAFDMNDGSNLCFYATFPSTWTDVVIDTSDSSFESMSTMGKHTEKLKIDVFDVTNDIRHFGGMHIGEPYPDATMDYLQTDKAFSNIEYYDQSYIINNKNDYLPMLTVLGYDKNNNSLNKKYIFFEYGDKKYLTEVSSTIDSKQITQSSYHDLRLIRSALELVNSVYEKDNYTATVTITDRPVG